MGVRFWSVTGIMKIETGYDFDDLLLVPQPSSVNSRSDVDLSVQLPNMTLDIPIIASPMRGIISPELIVELDKLGGLGILHRFYDNSEESSSHWYDDLKFVSEKCKNFGVAVGLDWEYEMVETALDFGAKVICIDVANGYLQNVIDFTEEVISWIGNNALLMVGNVIDLTGSWLILRDGASLVRVGIGTGGLCTTRKVTGVGYPQLSAINNCWKGAHRIIIADGGIRSSGDAVKCLAAGADLVMLGSLFGHCIEAEHDDGMIYGMASERLQEEYYHQTKSIEGISKTIRKNTSVKKFIKEFTDGMRSAFTYMNAKNIKELQQNAKWVRRP